MIKKTVSQNDFLEEFTKYSEGYAGKYSYEGKLALFNYLEDYSESIGEDVELDIIAICCDYTEYNSLEELREVYPDIKDFEDLNNKTMVIPVDNAMKTENFIIQNY